MHFLVYLYVFTSVHFNFFFSCQFRSRERGGSQIDNYVGIVSDSDLFNEIAKMRSAAQNGNALDKGCPAALATLKLRENAEPAGHP